jgi:hypothetical protein
VTSREVGVSAKLTIPLNAIIRIGDIGLSIHCNSKVSFHSLTIRKTHPDHDIQAALAMDHVA